MTSRVVLIDDEHQRIQALKKHWLSIFSAAEIDAKIIESTTFNIDSSTLFDRPHFIIVDNILEEVVGGRRREIENRGIDFIAEHKSNHQDTVFVLSTKGRFSIDVLAQKFPHPDLIVPKTALSSAEFRKNVATLIRKVAFRTPVGHLSIPNPKDSGSVDSFRNELTSILEQCLHNFAGSTKTSGIRQVNLYGLGGGYSGALVFRVELFDSNLRGSVPLVLKVARGESAAREVAAYNSFVRLSMPHDMRVDLLGSGEAGEYKGALYAFAFGASLDLSPLADHIRAGEYEFVERVVTRLFDSTDIGWYSRAEFTVSAEEFFADSEEYSHAKDSRRVDGLRETGVQLLGDSAVEVGLEFCRFGDIRFSFIRKFLEKFDRTSVPKCICHGDLNSNNILFGRGDNAVALIDFEYSGLDILYKDFVSLECSVRVDDVRFAIETHESFGERVLAELKSIRGELDGTVVYLDQLRRIRIAAEQCARRSSLDFSRDLYVLTLSFHLLKLLGITQLPLPARHQLLAAFCACGLYLEEA
jgi:hypothetical protein